MNPTPPDVPPIALPTGAGFGVPENEPPAASSFEARRATPRDFLGVSLFWLALSFLWGALLTIALPDHIEHLFGATAKDSALVTITASGALVAGAAQIIFGALSDGSTSRFGRRRPFLLAGAALAIVPLLLLPQVRTLGALVAVYALLQLTLNVAGGPYGALMHDIIPPRDQDSASAYIGVAGLLGRIGGPIMAVLLLGRGGFAAVMGAFAVVLLLVMAATLFLAREEPLREAPIASLSERVSATLRVPLRPYPDFRWLVLSRFGIMMGVYTVSNFLLYYIRDTLGFSNDASLGIVKNFLILSTVTGLLGTFPSAALARRFGRKAVLYGANTICMVAGLAFACASSLPLAYLAAGVFGAGFGAFAAVDWALATGLLPPKEPAKYMGVWGLSDTVSQVIAPLVAGPIALVFNRALAQGAGYRALMIVALVWFLVGTLALRPIRESAG